MKTEEAIARARELPDEPGWVDFRGMLLSGTSEVRGDARDYVLLSSIYPVVAVVGEPPEPLLRACVRGRPGELHVLCREESEPRLTELLSGWKRTRMILGTREQGPAVPLGGIEVRPLEPEAIQAVAEPLRSELTRNHSRCCMMATFTEGDPVSFATACWETERWFDISVETLKPFRRRGFGRACVERLIAEMSLRKKRPVWGAAEDNPASRRLAESLGFRPVDRAWVFSRKVFTTP